MLIVTNNPRFIEERALFEKMGYTIEYKDVNYITILEVVKNYVHSNWEVLTHPLYGSVKPNETMYRSIVVKKRKELQYKSLILIEDALATAVKFNKDKLVPNWTERVKEDFRVIDYDLISIAAERIVH